MLPRLADLYSRSARSPSRQVVCNSFRSFAAQSSRSISTHTVHTSRARPPPASVPCNRTRLNDPRRYLQTQRYQSFTPPSPESLGKAAPAKQYRRLIKWGRRLLFVSATTELLYLIDTQLYASSITRSLRTFGLGLVVALDYKLNFRPEPWFGGSIGDLHRRNAEKLFNLLHQNGGLYLKIGQAIAMQSAVLVCAHSPN
jgi:aarF domain-containing kinase